MITSETRAQPHRRRHTQTQVRTTRTQGRGRRHNRRRRGRTVTERSGHTGANADAQAQDAPQLDLPGAELEPVVVEPDLPHRHHLPGPRALSATGGGATGERAGGEWGERPGKRPAGTTLGQGASLKGSVAGEASSSPPLGKGRGPLGEASFPPPPATPPLREANAALSRGKRTRRFPEGS